MGPEETTLPKLDNNFHGHPAGHNVAGAFFIFWGFYWLVMTYWTYFTREPQRRKCKEVGLMSIFSDNRDEPLSFKSWFPLPCCPRAPLEPIVKILVPGLGMFVEIFFDFYPDWNDGGKVKFMVRPWKLQFLEKYGEFSQIDRLQHISMYLAFVISGVVDLLSVCCKMPRVTDKIFMTFAFFVEYILFAFHIHGRNTFNVEVHRLLLYFVISCVVFSALRLLTSSNLFINAGLSASMILQGTHLCQAGWILYGGIRWNPDGHNNIQFIASLTTWHLLAVGLFMMIVFVIMRAALRRKGKLRNLDGRLVSNHDSSEKIELMDLSNHDDALDV